jgi:hypothetical protein
MAAAAQEAPSSKVTLTICEAARLRSTQMFGTQDPFVVVKMKGNARCKTRVDEDGGTSPTWQQVLPAFTFSSGEDVLVHFEIWNQNSLSDTLIGECRARLSKLRQAANTPSRSLALNVLFKGKPYKSAVLRVEAKFDESQASAAANQARLGSVGTGLLTKHFSGGLRQRRPSLAALAAVHGNATQNLGPPPAFSPMAGAGIPAPAAPAPPTPQVAVATAGPSVAGFRGMASVATAGMAFRRNAGQTSTINNSTGVGIGFRPGYKAQGSHSASTMASVALAAQRFRGGLGRSQLRPQAQAVAVVVPTTPVMANAVGVGWQQAGQQAQRMGFAAAAFNGPGSRAQSYSRSASASSVSSQISDVGVSMNRMAAADGGIRKDLNLTPQHNINGTAFALTFRDGPLGLALVPTTYGFAMISDPPDAGTQGANYDLLPGDYVIAVGKFPLAKPGYIGVDGIVAALGQLTRPLRIAFFRFDFNKAHGRSGQTTGLGILPSAPLPEPVVPVALSPPPPPETPEPAASDWIETVDQSSGKTYFYNKKTNDVSWTRPEPCATPKLPSRLAISSEARASAAVDPAAAAVSEHNKRFPKASVDGSALFVTEHAKVPPVAPSMSEEEVLNTKVQQFMMMVGVGACPRPRILQLLDAAGGDVNRAINYFYQNGR